MRTVERFLRAAYSAAVRPAGPPPTTATSHTLARSTVDSMPKSWSRAPVALRYARLSYPPIQRSSMKNWGTPCWPVRWIISTAAASSFVTSISS